MEGAEWVWDNGVLREKHIADYKKEIERTNKQDLEEKMLSVFTDFISKI